ncbi:MAG: type II toxin-antitoxin system PemK/MazF family toxin [Solirubrobacterales bacterium]|nr:type II toxin-antitoxin system PemK/MazF family toxin [Solirubrobacterales bacterium]
MSPRRGEVWLVDFGDPVGREQAGRRPALLVSSDLLNDGRAGIVVVVPITTAHRGLPSHVEIDRDGSALDDVSYAKCEDVKSISEQRLVGRLGAVNDEAMFQTARALRFLLDL